MLDGFSSLSNDQSDLVPGNVHLEEATPSTVWATHAGWTALLPAALVGDDPIDGGSGSAVNKITDIDSLSGDTNTAQFSDQYVFIPSPCHHIAACSLYDEAPSASY